MNIIVFYFIIQLVNVMFNTVRLILTVKSSKFSASLFTAISYGIYTVVLVYTSADFSLLAKVIVAFTSNFIGVYLSRLILDKIRKDKVWKIEAIVPFGYLSTELHTIREELQKVNLKANILQEKDFIVISAFCDTQKETQLFTDTLKKYDAKFIAFEQNAKIIL